MSKKMICMKSYMKELYVGMLGEKYAIDHVRYSKHTIAIDMTVWYTMGLCMCRSWTVVLKPFKNENNDNSN